VVVREDALLRPSRHFVQQASDRCFKTTEQLYFTSYICFLKILTPFDPLYDTSRKIERERGQRIGKDEDEKRKKGKREGKNEDEKREKGQLGGKDEHEIGKKKQRGGEDENEKRKKKGDLRGKMRMRKGRKEQI
jgi:hypothetical protein